MVDYLANSDDELEKPRVKKPKLPKIAEPKDDVNDEYEQSLPKAKKVRREKSQAQLDGFRKAQEKRAQNIAKRKEQKEAEIAEKYLSKKQNQVVEPLDSESSSEEEEVYAPPKKVKKVKKAPAPKKKSKRKVIVYMSSSSEDEDSEDDDSSSEDEQPAPKKKTRVGRQLPEIENINYRTYFA